MLMRSARNAFNIFTTVAFYIFPEGINAWCVNWNMGQESGCCFVLRLNRRVGRRVATCSYVFGYRSDDSWNGYGQYNILSPHFLKVPFICVWLYYTVGMWIFIDVSSTKIIHYCWQVFYAHKLAIYLYNILKTKRNNLMIFKYNIDFSLNFELSIKLYSQYFLRVHYRMLIWHKLRNNMVIKVDQNAMSQVL